ncbi:MAG: hypothetical protein JSV19_02600 [Phycisphaerales bacterium]|nr:MAG: hypothetical protein JSV19_02600 [Phycisphaerales bacterium]
MEPGVRTQVEALEAAGYFVSLGERLDGSWWAVARKDSREIRAVSGRTCLEAVTELLRVLGFERPAEPQR